MLDSLNVSRLQVGYGFKLRFVKTPKLAFIFFFNLQAEILIILVKLENQYNRINRTCYTKTKPVRT